MGALHDGAYGHEAGEVTEMQRADVFMDSGVAAIHIRQTCAVTGERHPQKSVKTDEARTVPLPEEMSEFYDWATSGQPGDFVFGCFPFTATKQAHRTYRQGLPRNRRDAGRHASGRRETGQLLSQAPVQARWRRQGREC